MTRDKGKLELERHVRMTAGYDCGRFECKFGSDKCRLGSGGWHGKHGLTLGFYVKGPEGAVQFVIYTDWMPQAAKPDAIWMLPTDAWGGKFLVPADLGYHSKVPRYEEQTPVAEECEWCDGGPCYYDGSGLNAADAMYTLVNGGGDALWGFLEGYYKCVFGGGDYPEVTEYPTPERGEV